MPPFRRTTRSHQLVLLAFSRTDRLAAWQPAAVAVSVPTGPRVTYRCSPHPAHLDAGLALVTYVEQHRVLIAQGGWHSLMRREATRLVEAGEPARALTCLAVYAAPIGAPLDRLYAHHVEGQHVEPLGSTPEPSLTPDEWGR